MAIFTRLQLRTTQTDTKNFTVPRTMSLENNTSTTAYFNIEGVNGKDVFNSASLSSLVNCSVVTESMHAGFIINPNSTATFIFTPTSGTIAKEDIGFIAANSLVYSTLDSTSSGSAFGVNLNTDV